MDIPPIVSFSTCGTIFAFYLYRLLCERVIQARADGTCLSFCAKGVRLIRPFFIKSGD